MSRKTFLVLAFAILAFGGVILWLVGRVTSLPPPGSETSPPPPSPAEIAQERPPPPVTQQDLDRLATVVEMRGLFFSLRTAFQGGRPNARSRERMEAALRKLWPAAQPRWRTTCMNQVCQVAVEETSLDWHEALRRDEGVRAIADRIAWDPDGRDPAAFVLLAAEGAAAGGPTLEQVEQRLLSSPQVRACLSAATEPGTVEYELRIDTTGITYVRSGTADVAAQSCVEERLSEIITSTHLPPEVKSETRRVTLRAP